MSVFIYILAILGAIFVLTMITLPVVVWQKERLSELRWRENTLEDLLIRVEKLEKKRKG